QRLTAGPADRRAATAEEVLRLCRRPGGQARPGQALVLWRLREADEERGYAWLRGGSRPGRSVLDRGRAPGVFRELPLPVLGEALVSAVEEQPPRLRVAAGCQGAAAERRRSLQAARGY